MYLKHINISGDSCLGDMFGEPLNHFMNMSQHSPKAKKVNVLWGRLDVDKYYEREN